MCACLCTRVCHPQRTLTYLLCCSREICYFESTCRHGETRSDAKQRHCRNPQHFNTLTFSVWTRNETTGGRRSPHKRYRHTTKSAELLLLSFGGQTCACAAVGLLSWEDTLDAGNALFFSPFDASFAVIHTLSYNLSSSLSKKKMDYHCNTS